MTQNILIILNDPPYGTERSYNGLRLARALAKEEGVQMRIFLFGDSAGCAVAGQTTPDGYYNIERMVRAVTQKGAQVGVCGACLDARGLADVQLVQGAARSNLDALTEWSLWANKVFVF